MRITIYGNQAVMSVVWQPDYFGSFNRGDADHSERVVRRSNDFLAERQTVYHHQR